MSAPGGDRPTPVGLPERGDQGRPPRTSKVGTPGRVAILCLGSLAVMAPWPLLGIMLTRPSFDEPVEAFMLFGGITLIPLLILAILSVSEQVLVVLLMLVWLAAAVIPGLWLRRRLTSRVAIGILLGAQSMFSLAQALMGALMIVGKNV